MDKHKVTFFPIGNADTCRIDLSGGEKLLFDFCNSGDSSDKKDKRINLEKALQDDLDNADKQGFEVVAFTHLDQDHVQGASDFFEFQHCKKLQGDDRAEIKELWVPAAAIVETGLEHEDAITIQKEARHRLRQKKGIRVFSRPDVLKKWLKKNDIELADVTHLFSDAGSLVPPWSKKKHGVEFFVHCPFASRQDDEELIDRNSDAIFIQATFSVEERLTQLILSADVDSDVIDEIVRITRDVKKRPKRLSWDINNIPHHSSYKSLNKEEKGKTETTPTDNVDWLYSQGGKRGYLVSTSKPIPSNDKDDQPPHRQAANYYKRRVSDVEGEYRVTMEFPSIAEPEEMVFEIGILGAKLKKTETKGSTVASSQNASRAGG